MTSSISIAISSAILRIPSRCGRRSVQISTQMAMCGQKMRLGSFGISQAGERPTVPPFKVAGADESYSLHLHRHVKHSPLHTLSMEAKASPNCMSRYRGVLSLPLPHYHLTSLTLPM